MLFYKCAFGGPKGRVIWVWGFFGSRFLGRISWFCLGEACEMGIGGSGSFSDKGGGFGWRVFEGLIEYIIGLFGVCCWEGNIW